MSCDSCRQGDAWEHCYHELYKNFKVSLKMAWIVAICCCIVTVVVTIASLIMIHSLLTQWEYVEETCYEITQDDGVNTAIIGDESEVRVYDKPDSDRGTNDQNKDKKIPSKEG